MKRIYLACPYTSNSVGEVAYRVKAATDIARKLMAESCVSVFSPITHSHIIARDGSLPSDHSYWMQVDLPYIEKWADEVWVLTIDGWKSSRGVNEEIRTADSKGIPVRTINMDCKVGPHPF